MVDPIAPRRLIGLDGSPEQLADSLKRDLRNAAYELRHGRGDTSQANALAQRAERALMTVPPAVQPEIIEAVRELRDAEAAALRSAPHIATPAPRAAHRDGPVDVARTHLRHAFRALPRDPRAMAMHLGDHLAGHENAATVLRGLGRITPHAFGREAHGAGLSSTRAAEARDAVERIAGQSFHSEVVREAERDFRRGLTRFDRALTPRGLDEFVGELNGRDRYRIIDALNFGGADDEARALSQTFARMETGQASWNDIEGDVRASAREALTIVRDALRETHEDLFESGALVADFRGNAYDLFPNAVRRTAQRNGLDAAAAERIVSGHPSHDGSILERGAAHDVAERASVQSNAHLSAMVTMVVASALTGGLGGSALALSMAGIGMESAELAHTLHRRDVIGQAASVGAADRHAAVEAETEATFAEVAFVASVAFEAGAAAGHLSHGGPEDLVIIPNEALPPADYAPRREFGVQFDKIEAAVGFGARLPGVVNGGRHVAEHALEEHGDEH